MRLDAEVPPPGHGALGVVVPWSDRRFQYTVKDIGRPVHGTLTLHGRTHEVSGPGSFAALDHGRGKWAHTDDGTRTDLDGLVGWAEEARNRW
ncbi:DUF2804 family protein [Streptomyces sp. HUAS MG91]|uniref:DUF2804 family protein n=1 Tax=Streptomyces tabacisoli TaxID=3156398 RepID=A0AAU8IK56_9ACTN